mgnify:CR=1 FL=1
MWKIKIIYSSFPTIGIRLMYFYQSDLVHFVTGSESSITLKLPPASVYFSSCSLLSKRPRHHNKDFTQRDRVTCDSVHFVTGSESKNIKIGTLKLPPKRYLTHTPFYQSNLVHFLTGSAWQRFLRVTGQNVKNKNNILKLFPQAVFINKDFSQSEPGQM